MLNEQQKRAVEHGDGPMMVVAGPGSGKTRVLTERVRALLRRTTPERICVITFARKAADEMRGRFAAMTDKETADRVTFGTFHSVFFRMLRHWGLIAKDVRIMEEEELEQWLKDQGRDGNIPVSFLLQGDEGSTSHLGKSKGKKKGWTDTEKIRRAYFAYKRQNARIDFDDILKMMDAAIEYYAMFREYDYFLVDEFQDIDYQQYSILKRMVCAPGEEAKANLFVVGDEDQAIYAFRGSRPEIFLNFQEDFPTCERVDLSINYRSDPEIVKTSVSLISHNHSRFDKSIVPGKTKEGWFHRALIRKIYFDEQEEARHLCERIRWEYILKRGSIAVLCRSSQEAGRMAVYMREAGIPYTGRAEWNDRKERHAVSLQKDFELLKRLSVHPADKNVLESLSEAFPAVWQAGYYRRLEEGEEILEGLLQQNRMSASLRAEIRSLQKVSSWIREHPDNDKGGILRMLLETGYLFRAIQRIKKRQGGWLDLILQCKEIFYPSKHPVPILTIHGAKGLEFDTVYMVGLIQGKMPRKEALERDAERKEEAAIEEERRLMYVGMTRAKRKLILSAYNGLGTMISQFFNEMDTKGT